MTISPQERYGDVLYSTACPGEEERLSSLASAFDPASQAVLRNLGVGPGWSCLDVGAGGGTVTTWLAETTKDARQITALDRDTSLLQHLESTGLNIVEADVTDPALDLGRQFDLVYARFLLMHMRERDTLLDRLASWVKPGGLLVVSDALSTGGELSPHHAFRRTIQALWQTMADTIGTDRHCAARWPRRFVELGMTDVGLATHLPLLGYDKSFTRFLEATLLQSKERMLERGLTEQDFDDARAHINEPFNCEPFAALNTVWGRKPTAAAQPEKPQEQP